MPKNILASDIGGTSSRFAHFTRQDDGTLELQSTVWIKTAEAPSFSAMLQLLSQSSLGIGLNEVDCAVFAVAGPIEDGVFCSLSNVDWDIDLRDSQRDFGIRRAGLINDFLAQAYSAASPLGKAARLIVAGKSRRETIAVIGAGTGLGKASLVVQRDGSHVGVASEGAHATFAPESERELDFVRFLFGRVRDHYPTWEDVVSGRGLTAIHAFLTGQELTPAEVAQNFGSAPETFLWASRFYGRACRNFALETLATGGVYLAGGVAAKNPGLVEGPEFAHAFTDSVVHGDLLAQIPVYLLGDEQSGLWGAAYYASLLLSGEL